MGRKHYLKQKIDKYYRMVKKGNVKTRHHRMQVMKSIMDDLAELRYLPESFEKITDIHIIKLVNYWKNNQLDISTIAVKLSILRNFNQSWNLNINIPDNHSLECIKKQSINTLKNYSMKKLNSIYHPITKSIVECQLLFGVTKTESVRLSHYCFNENNRIYIYRAIAHNQKDRYIPILTENQRVVIAERLTLLKDKLYLGGLKLSDIYKLYGAECKYISLSPHANLRLFYAQQRIHDLEELGESKALTIVCEEMGIKINNLKRMMKWERKNLNL